MKLNSISKFLINRCEIKHGKIFSKEMNNRSYFGAIFDDITRWVNACWRRLALIRFGLNNKSFFVNIEYIPIIFNIPMKIFDRIVPTITAGLQAFSNSCADITCISGVIVDIDTVDKSKTYSDCYFFPNSILYSFCSILEEHTCHLCWWNCYGSTIQWRWKSSRYHYTSCC